MSIGKTKCLPLPPILTTFCSIHHHIHFATSPDIGHIAQTLFLFLFSPNLLNRPMPCLPSLPLVAAPLHVNSRRLASPQDSLPHLIRRHLARSETALRPLQPLHPPYHFTPVHVPQMDHHKVLQSLRCKTSPRPLPSLILWKELRSGI